MNPLGAGRKPPLQVKKAPPPLAGRRGLSTADCYLEGVLEDELLLDELFGFLWWCFFGAVVDEELSLDEEEAAGVDEDDDAGGLANAVPAIRAAAARAGIRYLKFIAVVSEMKEDLVSALRAARAPGEPKRAYYAGNPF